MSNQLLPGQDHFVNKVDETGLGAVDAVADESAPSSVWGEAWKQLRRRPLFWVALVIIMLSVLMAVVPQLFTSQDPTYCTLENSLQGPTKGHVFGFDKQGCDLYSRIIYGARASIAVGIFSTLTA
ncbi:MAG: ABC transporter permease, partial [Varibaculum cambriense]|nr:ABC transporter permease [Varibaculum cambriense]